MSMDDPNASDQQQVEPTVQRGVDTSDLMGAGASNANLIYILYLVGIVTGGLTSIVGIVLAYINRDKAPDWVKSHYTFQIHTFWKAVLFSFIGAVLMIVVIGFFIMIATLIWYIIRCVKGMQYISAGKPVPEPTTWMLG